MGKKNGKNGNDGDDEILTQERFEHVMKVIAPRYRKWPAGEGECFKHDITGFVRSDLMRYERLDLWRRRKIVETSVLESYMSTLIRMAKDIDCHFLAFFGFVGADVGFVEPETYRFRDVIKKFLRVNGIGPRAAADLIRKAADKEHPAKKDFRFFDKKKKVDIRVRKFLEIARILHVTPPGLACYYFYDFVITDELKRVLDGGEDEE